MNLAKVSDMLMGIFGKRGAIVLNDTDEHTGKWCKITIVEAAAFATLTMGGFSGTVTGITFPAGANIYGDITVIDLSGGNCIAYNR